MKLLLDTHTVLWLLSEPELLPARVLDAVMSPTNTLLLSIVSLWEMTIKSAKGSLRLPAANIDLVAAEVKVRGIALLQFEVEDLVLLEALPLIHKDRSTGRWWRRLAGTTSRLSLLIACLEHKESTSCGRDRGCRHTLALCASAASSL